MKKILAMLLLAATTLSGCIKSDDTYQKWAPVQQGMYIYSLSLLQHRIAMQPANAALRLASLLAEAGDETDLTKVTYTSGSNSYALLPRIFGTGSTVVKNGDDYVITYGGNLTGYDYIVPKGSLTVHTGGVALNETTASQRWTVEMGSDFKQTSVSSSGSDIVFEMFGGVTDIYLNDAGKYVISIASFDAKRSDMSFHSNWTGSFTLVPPQSDLKYSDVLGKNFTLSGYADGLTCVVALDSTQSTGVRVSYSVADGLYQTNSTPIDGTQVCKLLNSELISSFPSLMVEVITTLSSDKTSVLTTYKYNGYSVSD